LARRDKNVDCASLIQQAVARISAPASQRELTFLLAAFYREWRQPEQAYNVLSALAEKFPDDVSVKRQLLQTDLLRKDPALAQRLVDDIKKREGPSGWQWRYEQARLWYDDKNYQLHYPEIVSLLKENLLANPDDQPSRMLLAAAHEKGGNQRLAVATYREALNRSPQNLAIVIGAVAAFNRAREFEQADEILKQAAQAKLTHPILSKLELESYLRRGQLAPAAGILQELMIEDPNDQSARLLLASLKIKEKKFDEAGELLRKLLLQFPDSLPIKIAQLDWFIRQGQTEQALQLCNELVSLYHDASVHLIRARTLAALGRTDDARNDFAKAAELEPQNIKVWIQNSDFYYALGRNSLAADAITKALALDPNNITVQKRAMALFLTSQDQNLVRTGRNLLTQALTQNPQDAELRLYSVRMLLNHGTRPDLEQALEELRVLTEEQPRVTEAWTTLIELLLRQQQTGKAMDAVLRGLAYSPQSRTLLLWKARTEAVNAPVLALPTLRELYQSDPNDAEVTLALCDLLLAAGQPEQALDMIQKFPPSMDKILKYRMDLARAVALYKAGKKQDALPLFVSLADTPDIAPQALKAQLTLLREEKQWPRIQQILETWRQNHPADIQTIVAAAQDLYAARDDQATNISQQILQNLLLQHPNATDAMHILALISQSTGRFEQAASLYNRLLQIDPNNSVAINNLAWIMCEHQQKYQEALELAQRGLEESPDYIDLVDTRGMAYFRLGDLEKARRDFSQCVKLYPPQTPALAGSYFHLGRTLARLAQEDVSLKNEALKNLKQALDLNTKVQGLNPQEEVEALRLHNDLSQGV
jgi:cellulose synthase operon protein C